MGCHMATQKGEHCTEDYNMYVPSVEASLYIYHFTDVWLLLLDLLWFCF